MLNRDETKRLLTWTRRSKLSKWNQSILDVRSQESWLLFEARNAQLASRNAASDRRLEIYHEGKPSRKMDNIWLLVLASKLFSNYEQDIMADMFNSRRARKLKKGVPVSEIPICIVII